nr:helix-turn-helix domain-containing protein [Sphingopyxis sp. MSC1_008]
MPNRKAAPRSLRRASPPPLDPISIRISEVVRTTGLSRTKIYELIADGEIEAAKVGRATLVFVASLRSFLRAHPRPRHGGDRRSSRYESPRSPSSTPRMR